MPASPPQGSAIETIAIGFRRDLLWLALGGSIAAVAVGVLMILDEAARVPGILVVLAFVPAAVYFVSRLLTGPVLLLDAEGIEYRPYRRYRARVRWSDVAGANLRAASGGSPLRPTVWQLVLVARDPEAVAVERSGPIGALASAVTGETLTVTLNGLARGPDAIVAEVARLGGFEVRRESSA